MAKGISMVRHSRCMALAMAVLTLTVATSAQASFFVRPVLQYDGELVDGLSLNDQTQASQTFSDGFRSFEAHVDLADGTIKTYLEMNGPGDVFGASTGIMGDRIRFTGETGTPVRFSFDFDGVVEAAQETLGEADASASRYIAIEAHFAVYDPSAGATWDDWTIFGTNSDKALLVNFVPLTFNLSDPAFTEYVYNTDLGGMLDLVNGRSYDVFAAFNLIVVPGDDIGPIRMNFLNTGTIGIDAPDTASFTSQSGTFLGYAATPTGGVPEPSAWAMLIVGFGAIGAVARRRNAVVSA